MQRLALTSLHHAALQHWALLQLMLPDRQIVCFLGSELYSAILQIARSKELDELADPTARRTMRELVASAAEQRQAQECTFKPDTRKPHIPNALYTPAKAAFAVHAHAPAELVDRCDCSLFCTWPVHAVQMPSSGRMCQIGFCSHLPFHLCAVLTALQAPAYAAPPCQDANGASALASCVPEQAQLRA